MRVSNQKLLSKYYDRRASCKVLGCLMVNPKLIFSRSDIIDADYFFTRNHRALYDAIEALALTGKLEQINLGDIENWMYNNTQVTYNKFFEVGDESEWITSLIEDADLGSYSYYLDIVRKYSFLRDKIRSGQDVSDILDETELDLRLLEEQRNNFFDMSLQDIIRHYDRKNIDVKNKYSLRGKENSRKSGDDADEIWESFKESPDYGWRSESRFLDRVMRGCRRKMFMLESKDSGTGKTRLGVLQLCLLSCDEMWSYTEKCFKPNPYGETAPTLYIGTEMDLRREIEPIIWATISGVEEYKIKTQTFTEEEEQRLLYAKEISKRSFIFMENEPNYDVEFLRSIVEEHVSKNNIGAVILDYIETTPALIGEYARATRGMQVKEDQVLFSLSVELKNIANDFNVFLKAYTQISDNARRDWTIRDSGAIKGSKSLQMKADVAVVTMRPTEQELKLVEEACLRNCHTTPEGKLLLPNVVINVYKLRGGNYPPLRIFARQNLGNMHFVDLFVTDWNYVQMDKDEIKKLFLKARHVIEEEREEYNKRLEEEEAVAYEEEKTTEEPIQVGVTCRVDLETGEVVEFEEEEQPKPSGRFSGRRR